MPGSAAFSDTGVDEENTTILLTQTNHQKNGDTQDGDFNFDSSIPSSLLGSLFQSQIAMQESSLLIIFWQKRRRRILQQLVGVMGG